MDIFQAIILGIIQGITEWLPISSSGHLAIAQHLFGLKQPIAFDIMLHFGSLIVIMVYFRNELNELLFGIIRREKKSLLMLLFMIIATIPIVIMGLFFGGIVENAFQNLVFVGLGLIFTGILLYFSKYSTRKENEIKWYSALIMGVFQALALFPGISRSGSTISSGMILGIKREDAAKFSFIIFIPAIIGAMILKIDGIMMIENISAMIIGTIVSAIVGYFSLNLLMGIIKSNKFSYFSLYCLILGIITIVFSLF
jgi:undecaprenyl-diphosphatase